MNVALIIERIETWRGGAETSTMQFVAHLAQQDCQVTVVTLSPMPSTPKFTVTPIHVRTPFRARRTALFAERAADFVRAANVDIVHAITPCPVADVYQPRGGTVPEMLARNVAIRSSHIHRGVKRISQQFNRKYHVLADLERSLLTRPEPPLVVAISQYVAEQLKQHYRFDPDRIRIVFNGVDPDQTPADTVLEHRRQIRRQFNLPDDDRMVLCVAHNFKLKGVGRLIEAVARLDRKPDHPHFHVVIVGRDNPNPFLKLAERLHVADRVIFAGPTKRIDEFFHAADCLAHPTYYDPCSRVVLEAMSAGLPVITTRFNGASERITDGREGYVIDSPMDVAALADRLGRLLDHDHCRACGQAAANAVADATMEQHAIKIRQLYDDVLSASDSRKGSNR
jgi:UDP-glucose:(heptosyl)LPS alpha-1,3-glucosyltransferase